MYFSGSFNTQGSHNHSISYNTYIPSATSSCCTVSSPICAYPSWPRRSSLNSTSENSGPGSSDYYSSSFITDEELTMSDTRQPTRTPSYTFSSHSPASLSHCILSTEPRPPPCQVAQNSARDLVRELVELEKSKRSVRRRKNSSASKKSRTISNNSKHMSPIIE